LRGDFLDHSSSDFFGGLVFVQGAESMTARLVAAQVRNFGGDFAAGDFTQVIIDVARGDGAALIVIVEVLNSSEPGKSRQFLRMRARLRSLTTL